MVDIVAKKNNNLCQRLFILGELLCRNKEIREDYVMKTLELNRFMCPESVAIIGASKTPGAIGNRAIKNFADLQFKGKVYAVNPRYEEVEGFSCFPSLLAIPGSIDVVIIAVASKLVENAIRDCGEKKVKFLIIFSSGFAEMGEEGLMAQERILALCRENDIRVLGPNTTGIYNFKDKILLSFAVAANTDFLQGEVGLVSQSGATAGFIMNVATEEQVGFTYVMATGNQMDLNSLDCLEFLVEDDDSKLVALYMEGVPNGEQLKAITTRALSKHKPIIVHKSGRSAAGQKAALSHTASLTGSSLVFEMAAKRYGITLVNELEEMLDAIKAFRSGKRPGGNRVATLVISGAAGIMLADKLSEFGLEMANLTEATVARLAKVVPNYCSLSNPVDIGVTLLSNPILYKHCIETLISAAEVDILIVNLNLSLAVGGLKFAQDIAEVAKYSAKPIIVATTGPEKWMAEIRKFLTQNHVPAYSSLKSAAQAANYLLNYEKMYDKQQVLPAEIVKGASLGENLGSNDAPSVTEPEVKRLLTQFGVPVPRGVLGKDLNELLTLAKDLTFPLVAKIVSPQITHKSDVGGVILPIANEHALQQAYETIMNNVRQNVPAATIEGILIEEMVQGPFLEAIVGVTRDPVFGPVILCGLGGIYVEVMKDVSQSLAPISVDQALEMIQQLKSYPLFTGVRKGLTYDVKALAKTLSQVSQLAMSLGDIWSDFEINPLIVRPEGQGVLALDGLITLSRTCKGNAH